MELHEEVKKNPKAENLHLFCRCLPNLEDEIHLKGGRIVKFDLFVHSFKIVKFNLFVQLCEHSNVGNNIFCEIKINNKE